MEWRREPSGGYPAGGNPYPGAKLKEKAGCFLAPPGTPRGETPMDKFQDDMGDGRYDYLPVAERVPLHADKAEGFERAGDWFNATMHAMSCLSLGARGWIGTGPWRRAEAVRDRCLPLWEREKARELCGGGEGGWTPTRPCGTGSA